MFPQLIIEMISKVSPVIGGALGGPIGAAVAGLVSSILGGVDMHDADKVKEALQDPECEHKLKELELQLTDIQNARIEAGKDSGYLKVVRPFLALLAMVAIFVDVYAIQYVNNAILEQVLIVMLVVLVWDIRQIYKFYFGSSDDLPDLPFFKNKK